MDVTFVRAKDGAPYVDLGPSWRGFTEALNDAVGPLTPVGSAEESLSTYWIDRAFAKVRAMVTSGQSGHVQGGNTASLVVVDGNLVASSDYDLFDDESMPVEQFEEVLLAWRAEVIKVLQAEAPPIAQTYRRNPYPD